jgi:hypothetical protein
MRCLGLWLSDRNNEKHHKLSGWLAFRDDIWTQDLPNKKQEFETVSYDYDIRVFRFAVTNFSARCTSA